MANPHVLASIVRASEECEIVAHEDILDANGAKLWAKSQPISRALQQRLLERKLQQPLESCLRAADGVTHAALTAQARALLEAKPLLLSGVGPWADALLADIGSLPLHPVAQLLLTAARSNTPLAYQHGVMSMLLAGALASEAGGDRYQVRLHMLGGLLHDLGELYTQGDYLTTDGLPVDRDAWRQICVHPRLGEMLLQRQTDYPRELCRAVGEHHERGNGTGYPARSRQVSRLGSSLAAVEVFMGVLGTEHPDAWEHAGLAVRLLPSEFDPAAASFASHAARRHQALGAMPSIAAPDEIWSCAQAHRSAIQAALKASWALGSQAVSPRLTAEAGLVLSILQELLLACDALGLWAPRQLVGEQLHELHLVNQELNFRMQVLPRVVCWMDDRWSGKERIALDRIWGALRGESLDEAT